MGFSSARDLEAHEYTHKPKYLCSITSCEYSKLGFKTPNALRQHSANFHRSEPMTVIPGSLHKRRRLNTAGSLLGKQQGSANIRSPLANQLRPTSQVQAERRSVPWDWDAILLDSFTSFLTLDELPWVPPPNLDLVQQIAMQLVDRMNTKHYDLSTVLITMDRYERLRSALLQHNIHPTVWYLKNAALCDQLPMQHWTPMFENDQFSPSIKDKINANLILAEKQVLAWEKTQSGPARIDQHPPPPPIQAS